MGKKVITLLHIEVCLSGAMTENLTYSKTTVKRPLSKILKIGFQD